MGHPVHISEILRIKNVVKSWAEKSPFRTLERPYDALRKKIVKIEEKELLLR